MRAAWFWVVGLGLGACQLDATGAGSNGAITLGDGTQGTGGGTSMQPTTTEVGDASGDSGTTTSGASNDSSPDADDTASTASDESSTGPMATGGTTGGPVVAVTGAPNPYDFGAIAVGDNASAVLEVSNKGDADATGLAGAGLGTVFGYAGGNYPGTAGTCGDVLGAGDACTVDVVFTPVALGLHERTLVITYDDGPDAERPLVGGGAGQSANLLLNPGAENQGDPPPDWTEAGVGGWAAGPLPAEATPVTGNAIFYAESGPNNQAFLLRQVVDVSEWVSTIDQGAMRFSFEGQAHVFPGSDDDYRFRVHYRTADGLAVGSYTTDWQGATSWQTHGDVRTAPADTREIRVEMGCRKAFGDFCRAYFDVLDLRAVYP